MTLHLDIPDQSFDPKPYYPSRELAEAVLREIKDHIKRTGEPHTWRHHTHSKPVTGARIVYLGTFDLPESHQAADRFAPCPCCSPRAPKYSRAGKIAWFPDEHVIRMIGPECFQTLNPEGHWEAVAQFDREEAARRTISYLIGNLHLATDIRELVLRAAPSLAVIDQVHATLQQRINEVVRVDLWRHVGRGELSVSVEGRRLRRARSGAEEVETFLDIQQFSVFPAYKMFSPKASHLLGRSTTCAKRLSFIEFGGELQDRVRQMPPPDQAKAARMLSNGLTTAKNILADAEAIRDGFAAMSIATLKGWVRHPGCPVRLHIDGDRSSFYIGSDEHHQLRIELPSAFWTPFGELPTIATDLD
jgi:hypothetical protein